MCFFAISVCNFNCLPIHKHPYVLIVGDFSRARLVSGTKSMSVKNSYLLTFSDDKAEIVAVYLSKSNRALFFFGFIINCFDFLANSLFYNNFILNLNGLLDAKALSFTKNECRYLV